jgi:hypothetical protein
MSLHIGLAEIIFIVSQVICIIAYALFTEYGIIKSDGSGGTSPLTIE